jgi:polyisoprenoid-binding protein YceI
LTRIVKWVIGIVLILAVVISAGTFVYIHFIEGDAPKPLSLTDSTTSKSSGSTSATTASSGGSASSDVAGTWKVQTNGTQVGYRVKENLFGQKSTAVGRTSNVTGSVVISGTTVSNASFTADMTTVSSDRSQRDNQFHGRIMDTSKYPTATFTLTSPISLGTIPADGKVVSYTATGQLTLHGTTKTVTFTLKAVRSGANLKVNGQIPITFGDYNVPNPSFGPVTTEDHGIMEFLLVMVKN